MSFSHQLSVTFAFWQWQQKPCYQNFEEPHRHCTSLRPVTIQNLNLFWRICPQIRQNNLHLFLIFTGNIFVSIIPLFYSMYRVYNRLYQGSFLYRELKLRSSVVSGRQLKVLPHEQVYNTVSGIWNLSSDQGNLGTFIVSNVRLIWFADINESFNISLPYMQIGNVS